MLDPHRALFDKYSMHYERMAGPEKLPEDMQQLQRDRLPPWLDAIPRNARLLDAGCGQGHLLMALHRVGYANLRGFDLSSDMLAAARKLLPETTLLEQSSVQDFLSGAPVGTYDVVFFYDVLEHLPREQTIDVLRGFHRLLAPGGRLALRVPNMGALVGGYTSAMDFTHITHFTEFSLRQVFETAGFLPDSMTIVSQAPRLFWSWRKPHRAAFRLLNRCRWHISNAVQRSLFVLVDMRPRPSVFDANLLMVVQK